MKKGVSLIALALVSIISLIYPVFTAFASQPTVIIDPPQGDLESSFNFDITATSWSTLSAIRVKDPEGDTWLLEGGARTVTIVLDEGDSIRITWPEADISVLNGDVSIPTDLRWKNIGGDDSPHTSVMGTYSISFFGFGCFYFFCGSFFVVPEGPLGTIGAVLAMFSVYALRNRKNYTRG